MLDLYFGFVTKTILNNRANRAYITANTQIYFDVASLFIAPLQSAKPAITK